MTFFNKKEEVMKIELTPYGRYLLSIGKLKPHHYKFFDDNVVYDSKCMGVNSEERNDVHKRITEETPILKCNPNMTGVESSIRKLESTDASMNSVSMPMRDDMLHSNPNQLGTNDYKSNNNSHFKVDLFKGSLKHELAKRYYSSRKFGGADVPIPQIPIKFFVSASILSETQEAGANIADNSFVSEPFDDFTYFEFSVNNPIIRIKEINGFDEMDNFIVSAFKVRTEGDEEIYERSTIPARENLIKNGILMDPPDTNFLSDIQTEVEDDTFDLSYFFDLVFDKEIPEEDICATIGDLEVRNIYLDEKINCPDDLDEEFDSAVDIYGSRVRPEDLEDCD